MIRKFAIGSAILAIGLVAAGCGGDKPVETAPGAPTGAGAAPGGAAGGTTAAKPMYGPGEVMMIKTSIRKYEEMVRKEMINPKGSKFKADKVKMYNDLANNFIKNTLKFGDAGFNRPFPGNDAAVDQGRWLFEKEMILDSLKMMGAEAEPLRKKVMNHYNNVLKRAEGNKANINKAWRFPIRWSAE